MPTQSKAGRMRHVVNVMRPTKAKGTLGETQGTDKTVMKNWPCAIKTLTGNEQEDARQNGATANLEVSGYGNPGNPFKETDYLQFGERKLNIAFIDDVNQNGIELRLLCGENK
jgi:head-tail adaptor